MTALVLGGVALFSGCMKSGDNYASPQAATNNNTVNTTSNTINPVAKATVNYTLITMIPDPTINLQWNSGYITTTELLFNGTYVVGNMLKQIQFSTQTGQTMQLSGSMALGSVAVVPGSFDYGSFSLMLNQSSEAHALMLNGTYIIKNQKIPVQLIVDQQEELLSIGIKKPVITAQSYMATLFLNIGQIINGIDANTLSTAAVTNGTIFISATSNGALYQQILYNLNGLRGGIQVQFEALPVTSTSLNPIVAQSPVR